MQQLYNEFSRQGVETTYLYSNGGTIVEAQSRRERHIALLDSIMEEEEHEEAPLSEPLLSPPPMVGKGESLFYLNLSFLPFYRLGDLPGHQRVPCLHRAKRKVRLHLFQS